MVSAIVLLLIIATVATVLLSVKSAAISTQTAEVHHLRAVAAVLGATQLAAWQLEHDGGLQSDMARVVCEGDTSFDATPLFQFDGNLAGATFTLEVWPGADTVRIKGRASAGGDYYERWTQIPISKSGSTFTLAAYESVRLENDVIVDSFDSRLGAYGGGNTTAAAVVSTNSVSNDKCRLDDNAAVNGDVLAGPGANVAAVIKIKKHAVVTGLVGTLSEAVTIPLLSAPSDVGANLGDVTLDSGATVWSTNQHFQSLLVSGAAVITVSGNVTVLCDGQADFLNSVEVQILPNSSLTFYCGARVRFRDDVQINVNTADPSRLKVYLMGSDDHFDLKENAQVYAIGVNPGGELHVKDTSDFHGAFSGRKIHGSDHAGIHQDIALLGCPSSP